MKKICLFLVCAVLLFGFTACGGGDEAEVLEAARSLITAAEPLNDVYFGAGIETDGSADYGGYLLGSSTYLDGAGFHTTDELKAVTAAVYSEEVCAVLFARCFNATNEQNAHYHTVHATNRIDFSPDGWVDFLRGATDDYALDTLSVTECRADSATVTLTVTVTSADGERAERSLSLPMVREKSGWRLDKQIAVAFPID